MTFFEKLFAFKFKWLGNLIHSANGSFLQTAIDITNVVKNALQSKLIDFLTSVIPGTVDDKIVAILRANVPILLADELLLQQVGAPATEADAQALATKLVDAFGTLNDAAKEKFYTSIAAEIYIFLQQHQNGVKITFGQAATLAESFYQDWLQEQQNP